jgi:hypothetical protein
MIQKKLRTAAAMLLASVLTGSASFAQNPKKYITANITTNTLFDRDTTYVLGNLIYVTNNSTLTIEAGTVVYGYDGVLLSKGGLIVTKGSKLNAIGCANSPIVFTSGLANKSRGDWAGIVLLGKATVNQAGGVANIEGITPSALTEYGGGLTPDDNDNSGTLSYVRIEYAGVALSPNNELNSLTMGGVGRSTTLDHIMVSYANDDAFEWFGGTVNAKYLIAFSSLDDDFDTDNGYSGNVQYGVVLRDPAIADISGSNGFESDNDANASTNTPQTRATFSNITISAGGDTTINSLYRNGALIRRYSHMNLYNSILMGFPSGVTIDANGKTAPNTFTNVITDTMVKSNIFGVFAMGTKRIATAGPVGDSAVIQLLRDNADNRFYPGNTQILLRFPYRKTNTKGPDMRPNKTLGSPALTGANYSYPELADPFFTKTGTFVGAMGSKGSDDWTKGTGSTWWVQWNPQNLNYAVAQGTGCTPFVAPVTKPVAEVSVSVSVSPNPNTGVFNIIAKNFEATQLNVSITDVNTGKLVFTTKVNNSSVGSRIVTNLPAGYYVVSVTDGKAVANTKINILQ